MILTKITYLTLNYPASCIRIRFHIGTRVTVDAFMVYNGASHKSFPSNIYQRTIADTLPWGLYPDAPVRLESYSDQCRIKK